MIECLKREETTTSQQWRWTRTACCSPKWFVRFWPLCLVQFGLAGFALSSFAALRLAGSSWGLNWIKIDWGGASGARLQPAAIAVPWVKQQLCFLLVLSSWETVFSCCQSSWKCHYLVCLQHWVWPSGAVFERRLVLWPQLPNFDFVLPCILPEGCFSKKKNATKNELKELTLVSHILH